MKMRWMIKMTRLSNLKPYKIGTKFGTKVGKTTNRWTKGWFKKTPAKRRKKL